MKPNYKTLSNSETSIGNSLNNCGRQILLLPGHPGINNPAAYLMTTSPFRMTRQRLNVITHAL